MLSQRSSYLEEYKNEEFIADLKEILKKKIGTDEKYDELVNELNTLWECRLDNFGSQETGLLQFDCLVEFEQFTICLVATPQEIKQKVVSYFSEMLNVAV